ncbi:MAG: methanethiol S-methyltransferase, partial [Gemmatimonadota bacterium]
PGGLRPAGPGGSGPMSGARESRTLSLAWVGLANLASLAANLYLIGFLADAVVPRTVDAGPAAPPGEAALIDLGLIALFGLQHSVMARKAFKERWTRIVPEHLERATYVLVSSLALGLLFWLWRPIPIDVWSLSGPWAVAAWALFGSGLAITAAATLAIDPDDFAGLRQVRLHFSKETYEPPGFQTPGLYRYVRHPIYLGLLLVLWSTPRMTVGHLLFAAAATAYVLVGARFEERDLLRRFGEDYARYRERVPMLIPGTKRR